MASKFMSIELYWGTFKDGDKWIHKEVTLFTGAGDGDSIKLADEFLKGKDFNKKDFNATMHSYKRELGEPAIDKQVRHHGTDKHGLLTSHYLVWYVNM